MVGAAGADRTLVRVADDRGVADTNVQAYPGRYRPDRRGHGAARAVGATRRASPHRVLIDLGCDLDALSLPRRPQCRPRPPPKSSLITSAPASSSSVGSASATRCMRGTYYPTVMRRDRSYSYGTTTSSQSLTESGARARTESDRLCHVSFFRAPMGRRGHARTIEAHPFHKQRDRLLDVGPLPALDAAPGPRVVANVQPECRGEHNELTRCSSVRWES